jgi:uncharacterized protein
MAVSRRVFDRIAKQNPQLQPYRTVVLCAALLHDIGHGPFSHTCEEIFGSHHEHWTSRILRESEPVRSLLDRFAPNLLPQIEQVYQKQHPIPLVWQLVSSQLDCDRLDYLMRDSYFTGTSYGKLDLDRIVMAVDYDSATQQLVVAHKGMAAIEHYLIVRYFMYAQIYNHPKNIAASWTLEQAFRRARELLAVDDLPADETVSAWLQQNCDELALTDYLDADDGTFMYHVQRWQRHPDEILSDLCRRFINRDLPKTLDISYFSTEQQQIILQSIRAQIKTDELPSGPTFYVGLQTVFSRGYTLYQRGIKLKMEVGLQEISELSPLVKTLIQPWQRTWLIYPRNINATTILNRYRAKEHKALE